MLRKSRKKQSRKMKRVLRHYKKGGSAKKNSKGPKRISSNNFEEGLRPENQYKYLTPNELEAYHSIKRGNNKYVMALNNNGILRPFIKRNKLTKPNPKRVNKNNSHIVKLSNITKNNIVYGSLKRDKK